MFFKPLLGFSGLAKTASHNIFPEGEFIHETCGFSGSVEYLF